MTKPRNNKSMNGVNLGGWLVAEKWMTPSLFAGTKATNEYELSQTKVGNDRLRNHHEQFITETDIKWLKKHDVEIVRVPFGYWIFGDNAPYIGAIEQLDWLVKTTATHGIKVLLDLHAAPDAQNIYEHSGSGNRPREDTWLNNQPAQVATIEVLIKIALRYRDASNIWGIELLNEPAPGLTGLKLAHFYRRAYKAVIKVARPGTTIIFSDGYAPLLLTNALSLVAKRKFPIAMDCHFYHCFGAANKKLSFDEHFKKAKRISRLIRFLNLMQPIVVGEWSGMLPYRVSSEKTELFMDIQRQAFSGSKAHFYWNYKTEPPGRWNYRYMVEHQTTFSGKD